MLSAVITRLSSHRHPSGDGDQTLANPLRALRTGSQCVSRDVLCRRALQAAAAYTVVGVRRSACADKAVNQAKPVMMLMRWNSPPRLTSRGD
jgi:hypothetical protein